MMIQYVHLVQRLRIHGLYLHFPINLQSAVFLLRRGNFILYLILFIFLTDVDECKERSLDCEQTCINTVGSYYCACRDGFSLRYDNHTCEPNQHTEAQEDRLNQAATRDRCFASCDTVARLHDKLNSMQEKVCGYTLHS
jgi:hypothetical protein